MKFTAKLLTRSAAFALLTGAMPVFATVSLKLTDSDATPTSITVVPGATFTVTASLVSTSEKVTGIDYYLQTPASIAGKFRITNRVATGSSFSDLVKSNTGDNASNPGVIDTNFSLIATQAGLTLPRNSLDLGASIANVNTPLNAGTYILANYTLSIAANTPAGTYVLSTTSDAGTGWVGTAPFFNESAFSAQGAFSVTVQPVIAAPVLTPIPEPATVSLIGIAGATLLMRRRRA